MNWPVFRLSASLLIISFFLVSCAAINQSTMDKIALVDAGMKKQEVLDLIGPPGDRQFQGQDEAWQYCQTGWGNTDKFAVIWFQKGSVSGVTSYTRTGGYVGMCTTHFKTINWESAPDTAIEIRHR